MPLLFFLDFLLLLLFLKKTQEYILDHLLLKLKCNKTQRRITNQTLNPLLGRTTENGEKMLEVPARNEEQMPLSLSFHALYTCANYWINCIIKAMWLLLIGPSQ